MTCQRNSAFIVLAAVAALTVFSGSVFALTAQAPPAEAQSAANPIVRNSPPSSPRAEIPPEIAQEIAVANVGGGTIVEFGIDYENGRQVYEIEIVYEGNKYEMDIDAITGEITEYSAQIRSSHDYGHHDD